MAKRGFKLEIEDEPYWFFYDLNALCRFGKERGTTFPQFLDRLIDVVLEGMKLDNSSAAKLAEGADGIAEKLILALDPEDWRAAWWAGLLLNHPDITLEEAGKLLNQEDIFDVLPDFIKGVLDFSRGPKAARLREMLAKWTTSSTGTPSKPSQSSGSESPEPTSGDSPPDNSTPT